MTAILDHQAEGDWQRREWLRAYGSEERVQWVQQQLSVATGKYGCVNAHTETGGTSRKADFETIVPLTWAEHEELHQHGQRTFEAKYGIDLKAAAADTQRRWLIHERTTTRPAW